MALTLDDIYSDYAGINPPEGYDQSNMGFSPLLVEGYSEKEKNNYHIDWSELLGDIFHSNVSWDDYRLPVDLKDSPTARTILTNIYNIALREGLTPAQAVGILGNIAQESNFNINAKGDSGKSHGLFQMGKTERENFAKWKKENKDRISEFPDYLAQVIYVCDMMKSNKYRAHNMDNGLAYIYWDSDDPAKTALAFCAIYEKPGKPMMEKRIKYAQKFYNLFFNVLKR